MNYSKKKQPASLPIHTVVSHNEDTREAIAELARGIDSQSTCFVILFLPEQFQAEAVSSAIVQYMSTVTVFGCTTAGQISPAGYENNAFLAIAFNKKHFRIASCLIAPLSPFSLTSISKKVEHIEHHVDRTTNWNRLALLFTDGLSKHEDILIATLTACLPDISIFGGSAGDGQRFQQTLILYNGTLHSNAALLLLVTSDWDYDMIVFDHFNPTSTKMIVTKAIPDERIVLEINGAPADEEYARAVGTQVSTLSPEIFSKNPLLVQSGQNYHVRSIQSTTGQGGLSFLCAIDDGLILTLGQGQDIINTLDTELSQCHKNGNPPDFIIAFDCFLRRLEIEYRHLIEDASQVLRKHKVLGFNTYGEQYEGIHVNQTFVGIAFYQPDSKVLP